MLDLEWACELHDGSRELTIWHKMFLDRVRVCGAASLLGPIDESSASRILVLLESDHVD
jgi:hypothetical protein